VQCHCARPAKKKNRSLPPRRRTRPWRRPPRRLPRAPSTATASSPATPVPTSRSSTSPPRPPPPPRPRTTAAPRPRPDLRSPPRRPTARSSAPRSSALTRPTASRPRPPRAPRPPPRGPRLSAPPPSGTSSDSKTEPERQEGAFFGRPRGGRTVPRHFHHHGRGSKEGAKVAVQGEMGNSICCFLDWAFSVSWVLVLEVASAASWRRERFDISPIALRNAERDVFLTNIMRNL
jgi:hypothetical protein